jgi:hypothetical protein
MLENLLLACMTSAERYQVQPGHLLLPCLLLLLVRLLCGLLNMTLRDEILSRPDCAKALADRDCGALAAILSEGRTKLIERDIGYGTVLDTLGADAGAAFLDGLQALSASSSPVKWALKLLDRGELNVGAHATQAQLDALAEGGAMPVAVAQALKALAVVPDVVTAQDVQAALEGI